MESANITIINEPSVVVNDETISICRERGWQIFDLLSVSECVEALKELNDTIALANERFAVQLGLTLSRTYTCGEINGLGCAHLMHLWNIRIKAKTVASRLMLNDDLLCSMEGYLHFHNEYMTRQNLSNVVECDYINTGRWRAFVLLTDSYPSGGGIRIKVKHEEELRYVQMVRGSVLFIDPFRVEYKILIPRVVKKDWIRHGRKHSNRVVPEELCIAPITYHAASKVNIGIISQRLSCALARRATVSQVDVKRRRSLNNGGGKAYDNLYILPNMYVRPSDIGNKTVSEFRYENNGHIDWYLAHEDIKKLIQGTHYKEK